ncbi:hypothetical protein PTTG_29660 [Puccinia triticina 1-1 BBBD Race 1]|uniref:Uncharacterized protein n=2 Tax=Puccinia triticina TaxID=208348 RepID=A0A0C4EZ68_PUCT1|nr:uncharacterized protein PtA15_7A20 [Puccinia triticina]OAV86929.1 hypothetical protein PTTG_29660 [Puccinia triticina 1-1 BBBD Race 1]WAQ86294.1 hypothetical protein PtA15_7A20 [Puccinia triticina]WAR56172.1 hypothetical protein PtB15_7B17 [Puccinia triticina]
MAAAHLPPVSSPLANSGRTPTHPPGFGAAGTKPKCYIPLPIAFASRIPIMTASGKHSYRFTRDGIELMADNEKLKLLARRLRLSEIRASTPRPN